MLTSGTKIGGFLIGDLLGKGAMGEVYRGEQLSLKRPVAIKRIATHLLENEDMVKRFKREAQVLAKVSHPNVVGVIECEEFPGPDGSHHLLLIMELIEGGRSLKAHLGKPIDWRLATTVVRMCADGLAAAFEQQVVHRDIKPDNIMMTHKGIAKLVDFGLAKAAESTALTMQSAPMGTPLFMSPEACRGEEISHAGDLYSLGISWWFMLTGQYPFQAANLHGLLFKHISDPLPPPTGLFDHVPEPIVKLVYQCLEKDAARRPASAVKLAEMIEALPAQGILLPRDARELIGAGKSGTHIGGATTAATAVAGRVDRTAATIVGGATPAQEATRPTSVPTSGGATLPADLSPQGAVAATVVANLRDQEATRPTAIPPSSAATANTIIAPATAAANAATVIAPSAPAPAPAPAKSKAPLIAICVVAVLAIAGAGAWLALGRKPEAPAGNSTAQVQPPKPVADPPRAATQGGGTVVVAAPLPLPTGTTTPTPAPAPPAPKPVETPKPADPPVVAAAATTTPPKPADPPKPVVDPPKPADPPKPVIEQPKPVEQPKPTETPKPVDLPKPPPPPPADTTAFDGALAAKRWADAKAASDALPEPARTQTATQLTKAANSQLVATMKAAKVQFDQESYQDAYATLAADVQITSYADKSVREAFVKLANLVRDTAKKAQE